MTEWHRVPPDSPRIQRLKGDIVAARDRLTVDRTSLGAAEVQVEVDILMLDGCMRRLATALQEPEGD